jgi:hypothetical protein
MRDLSVNLTEEGEVVIDELCPEGDSLTEQEIMEKGRRLRRCSPTSTPRRPIAAELPSLNDVRLLSSLTIMCQKAAVPLRPDLHRIHARHAVLV